MVAVLETKMWECGREESQPGVMHQVGEKAIEVGQIW